MQQAGCLDHHRQYRHLYPHQKWYTGVPPGGTVLLENLLLRKLGGNAINVHLSEDCEGIRIVKRLLSYGSKAVVGDVITGDMPEHFAAEGGKTNSSPQIPGNLS